MAELFAIELRPLEKPSCCKGAEGLLDLDRARPTNVVGAESALSLRCEVGVRYSKVVRVLIALELGMVACVEALNSGKAMVELEGLSCRLASLLGVIGPLLSVGIPTDTREMLAPGGG